MSNFRQKSNLRLTSVLLDGQFSQVCPAPARWPTCTGFGSDSKVKFGSGPVNLNHGP